MPFFGLFWVTSWFSYFLSSNQALLRVPDYLSAALPSKVLSAVGNPLETYNPVVFPAQFNLGGLHSQKFSAVLPTLGLQAGSGIGEPLPNKDKVKSAVQSIRWIDALDNDLCVPASEQSNESAPFTPTIISKSASWIEVPGSRVSKISFSQRIMQVVQNLLNWPARFEPNEKAKPAPVAVVRTRYKSEAGENLNSSKLSQRRGFWLSLAKGKKNSSGKKAAEHEQFQVWVKGNLIAEIPDKVEAEAFAKRVAKLLQNPNLDGSQVQPMLLYGMPGGRLGNNQLFAIDEAIASNLDRNGELLAIEWVNNLRVALGAAPLTLVKAQAQLHGLVSTDDKFEGFASWYGDYFHGRLTANGEKYNQYALTAAHPSLPFNTFLKVTNTKNGDATIVRINDRGPYIAPRTLDLSRTAARCLKSEKAGVVPYEAVVMKQL